MEKFENLPRDKTISYWPLAIVLPLHFLTLEPKCGMFYRSRTTNIKVIEQNAFQFFENLPRDITPRVMDPRPRFQYTKYIQPLSMFIRTFSWEICYENFQEWQNLKTYQGDITPRVMGPWLPFCHYTFLILETKCSIRFIEVGSQT